MSNESNAPILEFLQGRVYPAPETYFSCEMQPARAAACSNEAKMQSHGQLRFLCACIAAVAIAGPPSSYAQEQQAPPAPTGAIKVAVELTLVEATAKDKTGRVMGALKKEDFRVFEDGREQTIAHFSRDQIPLAVALVVDLSGSIEPFLRPLRYATLSALKALKPEDQVALFTFTGDVERRVALTNDKRAVSDVFEDVRAGGATNINDAVYEAAHYLKEEAPAARRVVILVSDNVPSSEGHTPPAQVVKAALEADAAVYSIRVPGSNPLGSGLNARMRGGLVNVKKLTEETGGEVFEVEKDGSLFLSFKAVIERLKTRYTLGFYPQNAVQDGKFHALDVQLADVYGRKGSAYSVLSKKGYYAPRADSARN